MPRPKAEKLMAKATRFLTEGHSQDKVAEMLGISTRTLQRWIQAGDVEVKADLLDVAHQAVSEVLASESIRAQIEEIVNYRDSQRFFALEMGLVVQKATAVLLKAVQKLEENPDEMSARTIPQLLRAVTDASQKVSDSWARATGLDDILEQLRNEPKVISQGSQDT